MTDLMMKLGSRAARLLPKAPYPVLAGPLKGARFILGSFAGASGGASVFLNLSEQEQLSAFARIVKPGYTVFDIGANVGLYTILASKLVGGGGRVAAFEPLPRNIEYLEKHLALNEADNVRIFGVACSNETGEATLHLGSNCAVGRLYPPGGEQLAVETIRIDDLSEQEGFKPDVLKIDVEGAEIDVLRGGERVIRENRPAIFLSTHSPELRSGSKAILEDLGYSVSPLHTPEDPYEFLAVHSTQKGDER